MAAYAGKLLRVKALLDSGADVNATGLFLGYGNAVCTPLIAAADSGNTTLAQVLIDRGAKVDARDNSPTGQVETGDTALMHAAEYADLPMMKLLIAHGANLRIQDGWGWNAMFYAIEACSIPSIKLLHGCGLSVKDVPAQKGMRFALDGKGDRSLGVIQYLLNTGANANACGFDDGISLLMIACGAGHGREQDWVECPRIAKLLLERGANVNYRTKTGKTALSECSNREIAKILKLAGAKR